MNRRESGYSLIEVLGVVALMGIALGTSALFFRSDVGSLDDGASHVQGFLSQTRAKAMATTSSVRVSPAGDAELIGETSDSCSSGSWTSDPTLELELPEGVRLSDTSFSSGFGFIVYNILCNKLDAKES